MPWLWILVGALVVLVLVAVYGYNRLVRLRNEVGTGWANIDVQLQRHDVQLDRFAFGPQHAFQFREQAECAREVDA